MMIDIYDFWSNMAFHFFQINLISDGLLILTIIFNQPNLSVLIYKIEKLLNAQSFFFMTIADAVQWETMYTRIYKN